MRVVFLNPLADFMWWFGPGGPGLIFWSMPSTKVIMRMWLVFETSGVTRKTELKPERRICLVSEVVDFKTDEYIFHFSLS
ncbi:hypothetical protein NMG60_11030777 [Bertholletia excelsa]